MTSVQVKEQLAVIVDSLSPDNIDMVLSYANSLRQQQHRRPTFYAGSGKQDFDGWERSLAAAEAYWFQLPQQTRNQYGGQVVAIFESQIIDSDRSLRLLRKRVSAIYPEKPILYLDADAKQEPSLTIHTPQLV